MSSNCVEHLRIITARTIPDQWQTQECVLSQNKISWLNLAGFRWLYCCSMLLLYILLSDIVTFVESSRVLYFL